jgi:hypothetical protein
LGRVSEEKVIRETRDPVSRRVVLLARVWHEKILPKHIELAEEIEAVLLAVRSAEHSERDPTHPERLRYFARGVGPSRWLLVVVSYEQVPARVISAFAYRKDPPTWEA